MSSRQSGLVSNVQDRQGANPTDDVRLPDTQLPPDGHEYPPRHPARGVPPITLLAHSIPPSHDPEQARWRMPPDSSESSIQKRTLSKAKSEQVRPPKGGPSMVRECFIDDDRDGASLFHAAAEAI